MIIQFKGQIENVTNPETRQNGFQRDIKAHLWFTVNKMDDQKFDERTAAEWINIIENPKSSIRENDLYPLLTRWMKQVSPSQVLDVGCGQGVCSDKIPLDHCSYTGIEPSPCLVDRAKRNYPQINKKFIEGNIYKLPFAANTFDAVFSIAVWHLLSDLKKASSELSRVLKPNGSFLIITANPDVYSAWTEPYAEHFIMGSQFVGHQSRPDGSQSMDVFYLYSLDEIISPLQDVGLHIDRQETFRKFLSMSGRKN